MFDWFRNLFGFGVVLDLASRADQANKLIADATSLFDGIVADLQEAASELGQVAAEAYDAAQYHLQQQNAALAAQAAAVAKAAKVQEIFG